MMANDFYVLFRGLEFLTDRVNLRTGLAHPNDMGSAKELFVRLHEAGEPVYFKEIYQWALEHDWLDRDAAQLASLGEGIANGQQVRISGGPYWREDIIDQLRQVPAETV